MDHFILTYTITSFHGEGTEIEFGARGKNMVGYKKEDQGKPVDTRGRKDLEWTYFKEILSTIFGKEFCLLWH